jgi:hypothetical protein
MSRRVGRKVVCHPASCNSTVAVTQRNEGRQTLINLERFSCECTKTLPPVWFPAGKNSLKPPLAKGAARSAGDLRRGGTGNFGKYKRKLL